MRNFSTYCSGASWALLAVLVGGCAHTRGPAGEADDVAAERTFDRDHDGTVDRAEYTTRMTQLFNRLDRDRSGVLEGGEIDGKERWYGDTDRTKDGEVTVMEFLDAADAQFDRADTATPKQRLSRDELGAIVLPTP